MQAFDAHRAAGWQFVTAETAQDFRSAMLSHYLPIMVVPVRILSRGGALMIFLVICSCSSKDDVGSPDCRVVEPKEVQQDPFSGLEKAHAQAFGLIPYLNACALWGVTGCHPKDVVGLLMWRLMGTLSAARCVHMT